MFAAKSFCCRAARCGRTRGIAMPLRAKILNPAFGLGGASLIKRFASDSANQEEQEEFRPRKPRHPVESEEVIREWYGDAKEDVLFDTQFGVRTIELHRPEKLHSLNGSMIRKIVPRLREWAKSDMANVVIIKGSGPKAFCAGGDVKSLAEDNMTGEAGQRRSQNYFALEYKLDHYIATFNKPFIAYMDGITMGGGVGLSVHAPIRIATERTVFAMPETTIGFFPDVGASFFLPRLPGGLGMYLALTSERLTGVNVYYAGIATHYMHSTALPALERRLAELRFKDYDTMKRRLALINSTIEEYTTGLPFDEPILIKGELRNAIDRCFQKTNVPDLIAALKAEEGHTKEWAEKTLATLHKRSPTSVYVTLRQMQLGRRWSIKETFQREHQIAGKFMRHPDFTEGVDALLIRKDGNPQWTPASLEDIKPEDNIADPFFEVEGAERLPLLNDQDFREYPHSWLGIPSEAKIRHYVRSAPPKSQHEVVKHFVDEMNGKLGIMQIVQEVVNRKTIRRKGKAVWVGESGPEEMIGEPKDDPALSKSLGMSTEPDSTDDAEASSESHEETQDVANENQSAEENSENVQPAVDSEIAKGERKE